MKNKIKALISLFPIILIILLLIGAVVNAPDNYNELDDPKTKIIIDIKNSPLEFLVFVLLIVVIISILNKIHRKK